MKKMNIGGIGLAMMLAALLVTVGGTAAADPGAGMSPELATKKQNFRKQKEQYVSNDKRKAAAESLKAEREKVYRAKQAVKLADPEVGNKK